MSHYKTLEEQTDAINTSWLRDLNLTAVNQQYLHDAFIVSIELNPVTREIVYSSKPNKATLFMLDDVNDDDSALVRAKWDSKEDQADLGNFTWNDDN